MELASNKNLKFVTQEMLLANMHPVIAAVTLITRINKLLAT